MDPVTAAHNTSTAIRWLEYNDAWLGKEWTHPSDAIGAILPLCEYVSKIKMAKRLAPLTMKDVLVATIKAYEIVGVLALENSLNQIGVDSGVFTKVAVASVCTRLLGGGRREVANAASQAFADGASLRCFRHFPNVGTRKGWAAGDAASRGVWIALVTMKGEEGIDLVLSAPVWGFNDVFFRKDELRVPRAFKTHVVENVLFKPSFPCEYHAQTAVEACFSLHPQVVFRVDEVREIAVSTTRSAVRTIDKTGALTGPADREHCLRYCVAVGLLYGCLTAEHFSDAVANDPRIDSLRSKTFINEDPTYTDAYSDPDRRAVANAVQVHFSDRTSTSKVEVLYPLGHSRRRQECFPELGKKLLAALNTRMPATRADTVFDVVTNQQRFDAMAVTDFCDLFSPVPNPWVLGNTMNASAAGFGWDDALGRLGEHDAANVFGANANGKSTNRDPNGWDRENETDAPRIEYPDH